jgi:hypothetical protein
MKSILCNQNDVKAILDGRKSVTRRLVKPQPDSKHQSPLGYVISGLGQNREGYFGWGIDDYSGNIQYAKPPYKVGDILYVRETWQCINPYSDKEYVYKASCDNDFASDIGKWISSIHMPKEAARILLKVTDVRVERLQDIRCDSELDEVSMEGIILQSDIVTYCDLKNEFARLWDSTIDMKNHWMDQSWSANPWVWVIEFERISKESAYERD